MSVLLLDANGKVRSDADFYFYNNPVAADGSVQVLGKTPTADGSEDRISFDLTAVPSEVDRIVVAASRYEGARFGELEDVKLSLADGSGEELLRFAIDDADSVSAITSASCTGVEKSGNSAPSARGTTRAWPAWPRTSASISRTMRRPWWSRTPPPSMISRLTRRRRHPTDQRRKGCLRPSPLRADLRTRPSRGSRPRDHVPPRRRSPCPGRPRRRWRRTSMERGKTLPGDGAQERPGP